MVGEAQDELNEPCEVVSGVPLPEWMTQKMVLTMAL